MLHRSVIVLSSLVVIIVSVLVLTSVTQSPTTTVSARRPHPKGCYYQQVQCVRAPCPPILVCPTITPSPTRIPTSPTPGQRGCRVGGCSGQLCIEPGAGGITTCEYRAEYTCYKTATCTRQTTGKCGWTKTPELASCLQNPPQL